MAQYIDKSALVAEIEKRIKEVYGNEWGWAVQCSTYNEIISFINTLEVKEVDLDDNGEWKNTGGFGSTWNPDSLDYRPD